MLIAFTLAFVLMFLLSAFFSSAETAFFCSNKHNLAADADDNRRGARFALKLLATPTKFLSLILLGNNLVNIGISAFATLITVYYFGESAVVVTTVLVTLFILIFCETIPKSAAVRYPNELTVAYSYVIYPLSFILSPVIKVINLVVSSISTLLFERYDKQEDPEDSIERLRGAVVDARRVLQDSHSEMLLGLLDLDKIRVEDVMTRLVRIEGINFSNSRDEILAALGAAKHSHLAVYNDNMQHCLGFISVQSALLLEKHGCFSKDNLADLIEETSFIPESVFLLNLLGSFSKQLARAFVVNEYGEVQGMLTLQDILAKTMGALDAPFVVELEKEVYRVNTSIPLRSLNNHTAWNLGDDEVGSQVSTLRGLINETLEAIPAGPVCLQIGNYRLETIDKTIKDGEIAYVKIYQHPQDPKK